MRMMTMTAVLTMEKNQKEPLLMLAGLLMQMRAMRRAGERKLLFKVEVP